MKREKEREREQEGMTAVSNSQECVSPSDHQVVAEMVCTVYTV